MNTNSPGAVLHILFLFCPRPRGFTRVAVAKTFSYGKMVYVYFTVNKISKEEKLLTVMLMTESKCAITS